MSSSPDLNWMVFESLVEMRKTERAARDSLTDLREQFASGRIDLAELEDRVERRLRYEDWPAA